MQWSSIPEQTGNEKLSGDLKMQVLHFCGRKTGFSFTVPSEFDAYKAAYKWRHLDTVVSHAPNVGRWLVQIEEKRKNA